MGVTSFGQSLLKWFWWCRYVISNATPSRAMQHNFLTGCSDISEHWLKLSLRSSSEWRWLKVENQLQSKLTPCLSYWLLLRLPIKEGAKSTMLLPSMVQSAFPDWVHRNVEFSLQLFSFFFQWEGANICQTQCCLTLNHPLLLVSNLIRSSSAGLHIYMHSWKESFTFIIWRRVILAGFSSLPAELWSFNWELLPLTLNY